jgi:hypothetical protein
MFTDHIMSDFHLQVNMWNDGNAHLSLLRAETHRSLIDKPQLFWDGWTGPRMDGCVRISSVGLSGHMVSIGKCYFHPRLILYRLVCDLSLFILYPQMPAQARRPEASYLPL